MIKFYYNAAPNPANVALFLEESGLPYEIVPVDTRKGEQHEQAYSAINPNAKVPAIVDDGVVVFDSNAIPLCLAEKSGQFLPANTPQARGEMLSWLMFVASGVGPHSGQAAHLVLGDDAMAKLPNVKRLLDEINARLTAQRVDALKAHYNFKTDMEAQARKAFFPYVA